LSWNIRLSLEGIDALKASTRAIIDLEAHISRGPSAIIYNSSRSRTQHEERGYASAHGHVIGNGFDTRRWRPEPESRQRLRQEAGLSPDARIIGFVGRGHQQKDLPNLFSAFRKVVEADPTAFLMCVGRDLQEKNPGPTPNDRIFYLGQRADVEHIMPGFDLLCLSSAVEGFPNVIGEAMACGVPCVTTDVGDAAAVVGETGWVVPPRDSDALAGALLQALAASPGERQARGQAARARIETHFALEAVVARYNSLYADLAGRH
jgi:glycosyltransferase involved in cell wall biosynthesis